MGLEFTLSVIPAEAGIQWYPGLLDSGFRRSDEYSSFLQVVLHHTSDEVAYEEILTYMTILGRSFLFDQVKLRRVQ